MSLCVFRRTRQRRNWVFWFCREMRSNCSDLRLFEWFGEGFVHPSNEPLDGTIRLIRVVNQVVNKEWSYSMKNAVSVLEKSLEICIIFRRDEPSRSASHLHRTLDDVFNVGAQVNETNVSLWLSTWVDESDTCATCVTSTIWPAAAERFIGSNWTQ